MVVTDIDIRWANLILKEIKSDSNIPWTSTSRVGTTMFANNNLKSINYPRIHPTSDLNLMFDIKDSCQKYIRPNFTGTLAFCKYTKNILNHSGIFGKIAIWKLEPREDIEPHFDNLEYHLHVNRWIYNLNLDSASTDIIIDNKKLEIQQGWSFELELPLLHTFINKSSEVWYFLAFDVWKNV